MASGFVSLCHAFGLTDNKMQKGEKMTRKLITIVLALFFLVGILACGGGYYRVKDPATGSIYYTNDLKAQKGGAVTLKDANTGSTVTLQNSEVTQINKEEFKANTKKEQ